MNERTCLKCGSFFNVPDLEKLTVNQEHLIKYKCKKCKSVIEIRYFKDCKNVVNITTKLKI